MTASQDKFAAVKALVVGNVPHGRCFGGPIADVREYRGKRQHVVGYWWSRSRSMTAMGYDAILGWGETFDQAFAMAAKRIAKQAEKP